jgi:hypothetical protein
MIGGRPMDTGWVDNREQKLFSDNPETALLSVLRSSKRSN